MSPVIERHDDPFPCFTVDRALSEPLAAELRAMFDEPHAWEHHHGGFYECYLTEVSARVPAAFQAQLARQWAGLFEEPLTERVKVTLQRMEPGQQARVHTDRPLLGFETARLIVQLGERWSPGEGGVFCVHPDPAGERVSWERAPAWNQGFAFSMGKRSFHSVTPVRGMTRRTAVFHFWHAGNSPALAQQVRSLFEGCRFDRLPAEVVRVAERAERSEPEELTWRAGLLAWALHAWGVSGAGVAEAYLAALCSPEPWEQQGALSGQEATVALGRWVVELYAGEVDLRAWERLQRRLGPVQGAAEGWRARCFPLTARA